jgi:DNA-binding MarR family transcriptional regulator
MDITIMDISTITQERRRTVEQFGRMKRAWNVFAIQHLKPFGVAPKQSMFLRTLHQLGPCSLSDIASHTFTDPAAVVRLADVLTTRGWIVRQSHPSDRRCWTVRLSPRGKQLVVKLDLMFTRITQELLSPLDANELKQFNQLLEKLLASHLPENHGSKTMKRKTA